MATVNGEEITIGELKAETTAGDPQAGNEVAGQSATLRAVIDRKLWAQAARSSELDRQIQFILARRRAEEILLADMQVRAITSLIEPPSEDEIGEYLRNNPFAAATQTIFEIDQINLRPGSNTLLGDQLAKAKSLDEVEAMLARGSIAGQRSRTEWNSMFMPASLAARLQQMPPDRLFLYRSGDLLIAANVIAKKEVVLNEASRRILARQSVTQQRVKAAVLRRLVAMQRSAVIRVQPGFDKCCSQ